MRERETADCTGVVARPDPLDRVTAMPPLSYPTAAYLDEVARVHPECGRLLDTMRVDGDRIRNLYRLLGWSPAVLRLWGAFAKGLRDDAGGTPAVRELMICRIVQLKQAHYALGQHRRMGAAAGVSITQLDGIQGWKDSDLFNANERLFLQLADELAIDGKASAATVAALCGELGERATVDALVTGAFYLCVSAVLASLEPDQEHDAM